MEKLKQRNALAVLFFVLCFSVMGLAQEAEQQDEAVMTEVQQKMSKIISVEFSNTPIDEVLRSIAQQVDLDIVKGPDITGNVTATLTDVPLGEALDQILTAYNCGYVASENIIRIVPASQLSVETEKLVSKIYRIYYADVTQVEQTLSKVVSSRGSVASNKGTSNIIVTDTETNIRNIDDFLIELDRVTPQILVEARVYDITNTDGLDLGIEWGAGRNTGYGTNYPSIDDDSGRLTGGPITGYDNSDPFFGGAFSSATNKATGTTAGINFGLLNENVDVDMMLSAERVKNSAKLLANPRILVLDNETASFQAVREIPYQELQQGGYQSYGTTEFKEVGVELEVTPHLTKDGNIKLHITPVFSVYVSDVPLELVGTGAIMNQPIVDRRQADTIATVHDGDTVVIGGLKKQEVSQEISKIPLLGDIPIVGWLFRFEGEQLINSELVVFITPRIIGEPVLTDTEAMYLEATEIESPIAPKTRIDPATREFYITEEPAETVE